MADIQVRIDPTAFDVGKPLEGEPKTVIVLVGKTGVEKITIIFSNRPKGTIHNLEGSSRHLRVGVNPLLIKGFYLRNQKTTNAFLLDLAIFIDKGIIEVSSPPGIVLTSAAVAAL